MAISARAIFPGIAPISPGAEDDDGRVRNGWVAARGFDYRLAEVSGPQLAQAEFSDAEMVDASRKAREICAGLGLTFQIGAYDVEFDFVKRARAGRGAKKGFSLLVSLAANHPGREEEKLRQRFNIRDGLD